MDLIQVTEGRTRFMIPVQDPDSPFPPSSAPVFFNPKMVMNRDATVLLLSVLNPEEYLDTMGASGVRGLRVAGECRIPVVINDRNPAAADLIRTNLAEAGLEGRVTVEDANVLLSRERFDAVDLDPFGTPAPFTDAACRSAKRYLFVTATDTAPLCGAHLKAGIRRYATRPLNTEYHAEVGLRILLGYVARTMVKYDRGLSPLFCFASAHFMRLHLQAEKGADAADQTVARLGYLHHCPSCPERTEERGVLPHDHVCPRCGTMMLPIGPLWLGALNDTGLLDQMKACLPDLSLTTERRLGKLLDVLGAELSTSSHYDYHRIAKWIGGSPPAIEVVITRLTQAGYRASRAHYSGTALKTDAPLDAIAVALSAQ